MFENLKFKRKNTNILYNINLFINLTFLVLFLHRFSLKILKSALGIKISGLFSMIYKHSLSFDPYFNQLQRSRLIEINFVFISFR